MCEFYEDFQAENPFDGGYTLILGFGETNVDDGIDEDEARETLEDLFTENPWGFEEVLAYVDECEGIYDGDTTLGELALDVAEELGIEDYALEAPEE